MFGRLVGPDVAAARRPRGSRRGAHDHRPAHAAARADRPRRARADAERPVPQRPPGRRRAATSSASSARSTSSSSSRSPSPRSCSTSRRDPTSKWSGQKADDDTPRGPTARGRGARPRNDPFRRRLRRRHAADRHAVHRTVCRLRQRHQHGAGLFRPRSARPPARCPACRGFQVSFSSLDIYTPGDQPDVLVAMNPAALKTNVAELPRAAR